MKFRYNRFELVLYNFLIFSLNGDIFFTAHSSKSFYDITEDYEYSLRSSVLFTSERRKDLKLVEDFLS